MDIFARLDRIEQQQREDFAFVMQALARQRELLEQQMKQQLQLLGEQGEGLAKYQKHTDEMFTEMRQILVNLFSRVSDLEKRSHSH